MANALSEKYESYEDRSDERGDIALILSGSVEDVIIHILRTLKLSKIKMVH